MEFDVGDNISKGVHATSALERPDNLVQHPLNVRSLRLGIESEVGRQQRSVSFEYPLVIKIYVTVMVSQNTKTRSHAEIRDDCLEDLLLNKASLPESRRELCEQTNSQSAQSCSAILHRSSI